MAAKGGNYLLNVGPTDKGEIPDPSIERLEEMGAWIAINGEAIYGTEKLENSFGEGEDIRYTRKRGESLYYAIALKRPSGSIRFNNVIPEAGSSVFLLGYDQALDWSLAGNGVEINLPQGAADSNEYAWSFKIIGEESAR